MKVFSNHSMITKRTTARIIKWVTFAVSGLVLAVVLLFFAMQTAYMRELALGMLNSSLKDEDIRIEVSGITGILPFRFEIGELTFHDRLGKWMHIRDCSVSIAPFELLKGRLYIRKIYIEKTEIERLPVKNETGPEKRPEGFMPPDFLTWITVENIQIPEIDLGESVMGIPSQYRLSGGITDTAATEIRAFDFTIERRDGYIGSFVLSASINNNTGYSTVIISAHEPGRGLLHRFTGYGEDFRLSLEGEGLVNNWNGKLHASGEDTGEVFSDIHIESEGDYTFNITGKFLPDKNLLSENYCDLSKKGVDFKINGSFTDKEFLFNRLEAISGDTKAGFKGSVNPADLETRGSIDLTINDTACLEQFVKGYWADMLSIQGTIKGHLLRPDLDLSYTLSEITSEFFKTSKINGTAQVSLSGDNKSQGFITISGSGSTGEYLITVSDNDYRDKKIEYGFDLIINPLGRWEVKQFKAESGNLSALAYGYIDLKEKNITLDGKLGINDLDMLSKYIKKKILGSANVNFSIQGNPDNLKIEADAQINPLKCERFTCDHVSAGIRGVYLKDMASGKISIELIKGDQRLNAGSEFSISDSEVSLYNLSLTGMQTEIEGIISYNMQKTLVNGRLNLSSTDISEISMLFGHGIKGAVTGEIIFREAQGIQGIEASAKAKDIIYNDNMLKNLDISGRVSNNSGDFHFESIVTAGNYSYKSITVENIELKAHGKKDSADILIKGAGMASEEFTFEAEAAVKDHDGAKNLDITSMQGRYGQIPVKLMAPIELDYSPDTLTMSSIDIKVDTGNIKGLMNYASGTLDGNFLIEKMPMHLLALFEMPTLDGALDGEMKLGGTLSMPVISGNMEISGVGRKDVSNNSIPPHFFKAEYNFSDETISGEFVLEDLSGSSVKGTISLPCDFSIYPYILAPKGTEPIKGSLKGEFDMAAIPALFDIHGQLFSGRLAANIEIGGIYRAPLITGKALFSNGSYENTGVGIVLKNISANMSADNSGIIVDSLSANDGSGGKVSGEGYINIDAEKSFQYKITIALNSMQLSEHDMISVVAGGNAVISGSLDQHNISGRFNVQKADLQIPEKSPAEIIELGIKEINRETEHAPEKNLTQPGKSSINFNLTVSSNGRIYINGRGLESEWKGDLKLTGTAAAPLITGKLTIVRGNYNFLSRPFILTQGAVNFYGNSPPDPYFDIIGRAVNNNISAFINLKGNMKKPVFSLYSEPALPQDEIMSRILFDREISQITPVQALQLASAINEMMGRKGFDPLAYTRNLIGIGWLQVKQSEGSPGESALSAGKYLRENIYIEVEKGISAESGKASIKWELTPSITVDTKVGENSDTEMGVNYEYDY